MIQEITNKTCPECNGHGNHYMDDEYCSNCNGTGIILIPLEDAYDD